jgi:hypothetical protein
MDDAGEPEQDAREPTTALASFDQQPLQPEAPAQLLSPAQLQLLMQQQHQQQQLHEQHQQELLAAGVVLEAAPISLLDAFLANADAERLAGERCTYSCLLQL